MPEIVSKVVDAGKLIKHPENDNKMDDRKRSILQSRIALSGLYPAIVCRSLEESVEFAEAHALGQVQVLDGHHRLEIVQELKLPIRVEIWPGVTDAAARLFIATLNRLGGDADPEMHAALIKRIKQEQDLASGELAKIIPETEAEIDRILQKLGDVAGGSGAGDGSGSGEGTGSGQLEMLSIFASTEDAEVIRREIREWLETNDPQNEIMVGREGVALRSLLER